MSSHRRASSCPAFLASPVSLWPGPADQLDTVEGKSNETGLVWRTDRVVWRTDRVVWRGLILSAYLPRHRAPGGCSDPVLAHGMASRVKYVRLVRRRISERTRFWVQLIGEGHPYAVTARP
jgi:putative transposase